MKTIMEGIKKFGIGPKRVIIFVVIGIVGLLLILSSGAFEKERSETNVATQIDDVEYCKELENKVTELVIAITGDNEAVVAVTLENGSEYVYADQNTIDSDHSEDSAEGGTLKKESRKSEQQFIIVEDDSGAQTALIITEKKPSVRGVAIVASGIDENISARLLDAVSSMLGVAERKISITQKLY